VTDNAQVLVFVGWWRGQNGKEKKKKKMKRLPFIGNTYM
jgi:hypothetical protein